VSALAPPTLTKSVLFSVGASHVAQLMAVPPKTFALSLLHVRVMLSPKKPFLHDQSQFQLDW
jgi:hypothetical protein